MSDASFEDGAEKPLRLVAFEDDDMQVLSSLVQDAVFPANEMAWKRKDRRFAILLNRFRWEDAEAAERRSRAFERVQALLTVEQVQAVRSQGVSRDSETILSVLSVTFEARDGVEGTVTLTLAGDGAVAIDVEALEVTLRDVTRPYVAPSKAKPGHDV